MTIAVLGAGMIGRAIAADLAKNYPVTVFDLNGDNLELVKNIEPRIQTVGADLSLYSEYPNLFGPFDILVTAVPGFMGFRTLEAAISTGNHVVDISFFPEDALQLDQLAKQKGVTAITDCGVAPGVSNLVLGRYNEEMKVDAFACYVGGLPKERKPPFEYKAPFSPVDVIQEYIRPARLVEGGTIVTRPALSDRELLQFEHAGQLEAFNTDGLRSLLFTMGHIPDMKEKTLRYPGHVSLIIALQQAGFFDTTPLRFEDVDISPLDFTSRLLVNHWKLEPEEAEFTVMQIVVEGEGKRIQYDLYDEYDPLTKTSSMARTTGYTCTAAVNLIVKGLFTGSGVFPPELVGKDNACFDFVMQYLAERNVKWRKSETKK